MTRILQNTETVNRCSVIQEKQEMLQSPLWGQRKATFLEGGFFTSCYDTIVFHNAIVLFEVSS